MPPTARNRMCNVCGSSISLYYVVVDLLLLFLMALPASGFHMQFDLQRILPVATTSAEAAALSSPLGAQTRHITASIVVDTELIRARNLNLTTPSVNGYANMGCWNDSTNRILSATEFTTSILNPNLCQSMCASNGYTVFGVEYGVQCYCGNSIAPFAVTASPESCSYGCSGYATDACGGFWFINVYSATVPLSTTSSTSSLTITGTASITGLGTSSTVTVVSEASMTTILTSLAATTSTPTNPASVPTSEPSSGGSGLRAGQIAGITVGSVALAALVASGAFVLCYRVRRNKNNAQPSRSSAVPVEPRDNPTPSMVPSPWFQTTSQQFGALQLPGATTVSTKTWDPPLVFERTVSGQTHSMVFDGVASPAWQGDGRQAHEMEAAVPSELPYSPEIRSLSR